MFYSQLENERRIHENFLKSGRQDKIAQIVLEKIEIKIKKLEKIYDKGIEGKEIFEPGHNARKPQFFFKVVYRLRDYKNRSYRALHQLFTSTQKGVSEVVG